MHEGWMLAVQLLALSVTPEAMKSYFMTTYLKNWWWCDVVLDKKSLNSSCLLSGWRQLSPLRMETAIVQNMHEFSHNPLCPLAERQGLAYLLRVLSAAHETPGTQFVTVRIALTGEFKWM